MLRLALCLLLALLPAAGLRARAARGGPVYKGAIVVDAATGDVLFEGHADEISPPASMTKLMTFAVLHDRLAHGALRLDTMVKVVAADTRAAPSRVDLKVGETYPLEELIYAMMIPSANYAALAVARVVGGSVPAFVELMNAKARELGMSHTSFRTPNGLPPPSRRLIDGDLTTPRDFARLCRYLLQHTDILKYTSVRTRLFGHNYRFPPLPMTNHNHLLGKIDGVDGLKTGFTNGAGFCLAATAKRGGRRIIVVMMDCPDARDRDLAVIQLIESAFMRPTFVKPTIAPTAGQAIVPAPAASAEASAGQASAVPAPGGPIVHFSVPGQGQ